MQSNPIFEKAVSFVNHTNQHIFLTGKAGTGKTTFLKYIRAHSHKQIVVVAPTGVAAINAGGSTIHSFFYLPFGTYIPTTRTVWGGMDTNVYNKHQLFEKARLSTEKREIIRNMDTLVIDEISMVRADVLDAIDALLRMVRRRPETPFGGVQMVFIGDMFQLPPVVKDADWEHLSTVYESPFFFDALVMKEAEPVYIELKTIYRQTDDAYINILNRIRNNEAEAEDLELLNERYNPYFMPDAYSGFITLTTHNYKADEINQTALAQLSDEPVVFEAKITGTFPPHAYPVEEHLVLKVGAQIMFIKNDKGETRRYYNGKIGTISALNKASNKITVRFVDEDTELEIEPEVWENIKYDFDRDADEIKEEKLGTFAQFPIRLAWAVTIHKSQGLTFDRAVVDAGQSFAPGQVYVALSRLRSLDGLILKSRITASSIYTDPKILEFAKHAAKDDALDNILGMSQKMFAEQALVRAFDCMDLYDRWLEFTKDLVRRNIPEKDDAGAFALQQLDQIKVLDHTAQKFEPQLVAIVNDTASDRYMRLKERVQAGANWFLQILQPVIAQTKTHIATYKIKKGTKKYVKDVQGLLQMTEKKRVQLEQAAAIAEGLAAEMKMGAVIEEVNKMFAPMPLTEDESAAQEEGKKPKVSTRELSLQLYREGKSPEKIAELRNLALSTIYSHLAAAVAAGDLKVDEFVAPKDIQVIRKAFEEHPGEGISRIKEMLGQEYTFNDIKLVKAHLEFEQSKA